METHTPTKTTCRDCQQAHDSFEACRVRDLPEALISDGPWSIRETPAQGRGLWKSYTSQGVKVAFCVGAMYGADADALAQAIDSAEEESRCLLAEARIEFGF